MTIQNENAAEPKGTSDSINRRDAITAAAAKSSQFLTALGIGAIPVALAALSRSASAQTTTDLKDALQFCLLVAQLQADFHLRAASSSGFLPAADLSPMSGIRVQDGAQVQVIGSIITGQNDTPADQPIFDYTAKGAFPGFGFTSGQYATYQIMAQGLEDLGVRAMKGQVARMTANTNVMSQMATLASVQGRHAAEVRRIRGKKPWVTLKSRDDLPAFFQPAYDGEELTVHNGFDSSALAAANGGANPVSEAFDEPLTKAQAMVIVQKFLP